MTSLSARASQFVLGSAETGADAAVTIAARTFALMQPGRENAPEAARMVEEKVAAACEGAVSASFAWGAFLFASAMRGGATPIQLSHALFDVAEAASAPASRAARGERHSAHAFLQAELRTMALVETLHHVIAQYGYFAVFAVVALESAGVPLPGETALLTAAVFAGQGTLNIWGVIACAAVGAILGDNGGYWVGREFGFPLLFRYGRVLRLDEGKLKVAQYLFLRHGGKIVFFGRFVAILRTFAAFLSGVNRLTYSRFLLFNAAGGILWACVFGLGGYFLGVAFETYARPVGIAALVGAVIAAVVASRFISHHAESLRAEAEAALPGPLLAPR